MTKNLFPPTRPPRVSVPISPEVLEVFKRLGRAGNMSTGAAIADWLGDTAEAAEFMASKMEQARAAPKAVMREMHAYALGLADETGEMMRKITEKGASDRASAGKRSAATPVEAPNPPPCNTGGKVSKTSTPKNSRGGV